MIKNIGGYYGKYPNPFRFWAQKVLPLVYDDSLSYYEVLEKVVAYLNDATADLQAFENEYQENAVPLLAALEDILQGNFPEAFTAAMHEWMSENAIELIGTLVKQVYFGLTDAGYFIAYVPDSWDDITFNTTGYDYEETYAGYGHLVLSY